MEKKPQDHQQDTEEQFPPLSGEIYPLSSNHGEVPTPSVTGPNLSHMYDITDSFNDVEAANPSQLERQSHFPGVNPSSDHAGWSYEPIPTRDLIPYNHPSYPGFGLQATQPETYWEHQPGPTVIIHPFPPASNDPLSPLDDGENAGNVIDSNVISLGLWTCPHKGCGHTTNRRDNLERHLRSKRHTDVKSFSCPQCGRRSARGDNVKQHLRTCKGPSNKDDVAASDNYDDDSDGPHASTSTS